ncbi:UNVERIFIED_CONTAM: hypothetical protein Slati_0972200 [Sesamum latifolium]|uniref:DUF7705 domain-containing protein n=1 Tax=Sesamum latifolium TaxID=2727402 RepID=A0AAW2XX50_9LAMI
MNITITTNSHPDSILVFLRSSVRNDDGILLAVTVVYLGDRSSSSCCWPAASFSSFNNSIIRRKFICVSDGGARNEEPECTICVWKLGISAMKLAWKRQTWAAQEWMTVLIFTAQLLSGVFVDKGSTCGVHQKVKELDNRLGADPDIYAAEKELFLGSLCEVPDSVEPWYFWMIMLKNGNFDKNTTLCPENGKKVPKIVTDRSFPCFGEGCMNQPLVYHNQSKMVVFSDNNVSLVGGYYGTYDLDANLSAGVADKSFFSVTWQKNFSTSSWILSHKLTTSSKYPWLMLYLRADAANGFNGGYHYNGRGIMTKLPESPNFKVRLTLDVKQGGGANSQFYLLDMEVVG